MPKRSTSSRPMRPHRSRRSVRNYRTVLPDAPKPVRGQIPFDFDAALNAGHRTEDSTNYPSKK